MHSNIPPLFQPEPILEHRLGSKVFDDFPNLPGIYRFYDKNGELLYVGKAKNLRTRLFSYKRAKPGRVSGKVSKLIGRICSIEYETSQTEQDALLLENRWIREKQPPFNHANKQTETYYFVFLKPDEMTLEFRLAMRIHDETEEAYWHGCFKGHRPVRQSFGCLLRLLWMAEHNINSPMHLPVQLTRNLTPMRFSLPWQRTGSAALRDELPKMLNRWMKGESCEIINWFLVQIECGKRLTPFQTLHLEYHLECLKRFYDQKLVPHRLMRGSESLIGQDELDDLLVV